MPIPLHEGMLLRANIISITSNLLSKIDKTSTACNNTSVDSLDRRRLHSVPQTAADAAPTQHASASSLDELICFVARPSVFLADFATPTMGSTMQPAPVSTGVHPWPWRPKTKRCNVLFPRHLTTIQLDIYFLCYIFFSRCKYTHSATAAHVSDMQHDVVHGPPLAAV